MCESEVAQSCLTHRAPRAAAHQAPPSMGFSRQKYWSGVPLPSPQWGRKEQEVLPSKSVLGLGRPGFTSRHFKKPSQVLIS